MAISKVIYGGRTLIDLTGDSVTPDKLKKGCTAHGANGEFITGTCTYDSDTTSATAKDSEILMGKTAYVNKNEVTGTMSNHGAVTGSITDVKEGYTIPPGYHDGGGKVNISNEDIGKLVASNIRKGIVILGVEGGMEGTESVKVHQKSVTPSITAQIVTPDTGYDYLSQVTVAAIPYAETESDTYGTTVTIG